MTSTRSGWGAGAMLLVGLGLVTTATPHAAAINVSLYQRVEETMVNANAFANRFTETELRLAVTAPAGRALGSAFTWYGFHDGDGGGGQNGTVWKFRLLFDTPGTWTVDAGFFVPGTGTANGPAQQFVYDVSAEKLPGEHGHVRVDPQNALRLRHDDGTAWVPFAIHSSGLLGRDQVIAFQWIDEHAALGVDALAVRVHSEAYGSDPERYHFLLANGTSGTSWPAAGVNGFDYTRYDVPIWRHSEQIIACAEARGVKLSIWFGISGLNTQYNSYGPRDWPDDTTLGVNQKRFIRYFLSRWAPYTLWWHWTVDSEYEEGGGGALDRVRTYAAELRARNPWRTVVTTHVLSDWSPGYAPELDLATLQRRVVNSDAGATDCRSFVTENAAYGRPIYNAEGVWGLSNVTRSRVATWAHLMAGGFSHVAHSGGGGPLSSSWQVTWDQVNVRHKQDAAELGKLSEFFNRTAGIDIGRCVPRNDLASVVGGHLAMCLAEPGQRYHVWVDEGGTASVNLTGVTGQFAVARYRCTQLTTPVTLPMVVGGGTVGLGATPTSGFGQDYLFVLTRQAPTVTGDFDGDADVDLEDYGHLQACQGPTAPAGCGDADLNGDFTIDELDVGVFIECLGGAGQPPGCP